MPVPVAKNEVRSPADHFEHEGLFHVLAHLVEGVEVKEQDPLALRLVELRDARADKVLAQQHAEHRRLGGIFKARVRQVRPRAADAAAEDETAVPGGTVEAQQHGVALRLLHLVDLSAHDGGAQLRGERGESDGIKWHRSFPFPAFRPRWRRRKAR